MAANVATIAADLFNGWGYNFYRLANRLRADDLLVRAKVSDMLAAARLSVQAAERAYRDANLPPPSRDKPLPDAAAMRDARALERLGGAIGQTEGHVRAQPVPEPDRMAKMVRSEADGLARLLEADQALAGHAGFLQSVLRDADAAWMLANLALLTEQVGSLDAALQERKRLLDA